MVENKVYKSAKNFLGPRETWKCGWFQVEKAKGQSLTCHASLGIGVNLTKEMVLSLRKTIITPCVKYIGI